MPPLSYADVVNTLNLSMAAVAVWFGASLAQRRWLGKPLFARADPQAVFVERWVSGRANESFFTRLGAARNCLQVQVTPTELHLQPHFPLTLGFVPEIYDLERRIPLSRISAVQVVGGRHAKAIEIRYRRTDGQPGNLLLLVRKAPAFLAAVKTSPTNIQEPELMMGESPPAR